MTVCATPVDAGLALKVASPPYVAVIVLAPEVSEVRLQPAAVTVAVQLFVPSLTLTFPVGVPPPEVGATE